MYGFFSRGQHPLQAPNSLSDWCYLSDGFALNHNKSAEEKSGWMLWLHGAHIKSLSEQTEGKSFIDLYLEFGYEFAKYFDGDFVFILYHKSTHKLVIINNRTQAHKLYYSETQSGFVFANDLRILRKLGAGGMVHLGSVQGFISNGFTISDQTQIHGIKKLLPAFALEITNNGLELSEYWNKDFYFSKEPLGNIEDAIEKYESLYQEGVQSFVDDYQTRELGTLLSGGHDTSFCLIESSRVFKKPLHTFTCTFPNWAFNEEKYAHHLSDKFGAKFHPVPFYPHHLDQVIGLINNCQEPVVGSCLPLHILGKEASQHVDTLFGGDGGDTLWGEYYPVQEYHRWIKDLPSFARKGLHTFSRTMRDLTDWERFWELEHVSSLFVGDNYYNDFLRKLCTYRHFPDDLQRELLTSEVLGHQIPRSILEIPFDKNNFARSLIEGKLYNGFFTYQSFSQYRTLEAHNMAIFFPTLYKPVMDFICSLPWSWINGGSALHRLTNNKTINRRFHKVVLSRYLARDEIYNRSFDMPWHSILGPRKDVLEKLLLALKKRGWFRSQPLTDIFQEFEQQRVKDYELLELKHHGYRIYTLLVLEVWCRLFIDNLSGFDEKTKLEDFLS